MKLLSHVGDTLVFLIEASELDLIRWLMEQETGPRHPVVLSRSGEGLPEEAAADLELAMSERRRANLDFLRSVLQLNGSYLRSSTSSEDGCGLTLSHGDVERLLQVFNDIKLAHWERLGCPEDGASLKRKPTPEEWPSLAVMDVVNEIQMLLLYALNVRD